MQQTDRPDPDELLSIGQVMELTGAPRSTVHRALRSGALPVAAKRGNRRLVRRADADAWVIPQPAAHDQAWALGVLNGLGEWASEWEAAGVHQALGVLLPPRLFFLCTDHRREVRQQLAWQADIWRRMAAAPERKGGLTPEQCTAMAERLDALRGMIRPGSTELPTDSPPHPPQQ